MWMYVIAAVALGLVVLRLILTDKQESFSNTGTSAEPFISIDHLDSLVTPIDDHIIDIVEEYGNPTYPKAY